MPRTGEFWKRIPGYPAYTISNYGVVRSYWKRLGTRKHLKMVIGSEFKTIKWAGESNNRVHVWLSKGQGDCGKTRGVAYLVLLTFVRPPEPGGEARHYHDPNPINCHVDNLRWGTRRENVEDIRRHVGKLPAEREWTQEQKDAASRSRKGRKHSEATKLKIAKGLARHRARQKG